MIDTTRKSTRIGFIGTGVMGKSMAGHLLKAGYPLNVFNRTRNKAEALVQDGATWKNSPAEVARSSDVVITIVGFPQDVEATYLGDEGIIANMAGGGMAIDMTTSKPQLAVKIHQAASSRNVHVLDAPVSGGDRGAREGTLSIMSGGDPEAFEAARPLFEIMGKNIVYQGNAGSGQYTKMCNQIAIAGGMLAICEALAYAEKSGLNPKTVLESISGGAAGSWSLSNLAPRIIKGDFAPGFYVKHFIKDMNIALESAREMGLETPVLEKALDMYQKLSDQGGSELGTQAIYKLFKPN